MEYRVVNISNNIDEYPECKKDTEQFPHLVKHVGDEMDTFIVDENGKFWPAGEFFSMVTVINFKVQKTLTKT